jgi:AraC-like DNA-binding protein
MHPESPKDQPLQEAPSPWRTKLFETSDADELLHHFNTETPNIVTKVVPLDSKAHFTFRRAEIDLGRIRLTKGKSTAFHMEGGSTCLSITVSEAGHCIIKDYQNQTVFQSHRGDSAVVGGIRPGDAGIFQTSPDGMRFVIRLDEQHVTNQLAVGEALSKTITRGILSLDLSTPMGVGFHRAVNFIWQQRTPPTELLRAAFDEILLQGVVSLFTPVLSDDAPARVADPGPAHLKRACELIRANVAEPVRIAEIATQLGISPRHLQAGFRQHLGTTPQRFLRDCRLDEANRRLSAAKPGATTTAIAYDCGFGHLGEFAQSYRQRFGESPSETLRRSCGRA